jgi:hypothetical protein
MKDDLVGYVLDCLDEGTQRAVDRYVQTSEGRRELERVRSALAPLESDRGDPEPPRDLLIRTLALVAEQGPRTLPHSLPRAPAPSRAGGGSRGFWRRADLLVAASLLLLVGGLTALAVLQVRRTSAVAACQNNLREFHAALVGFHDQHGQFPNVTSVKNRAAAGMVMPLLISTGFLPRDANVRCPEAGPPKPCPWSLEQIQKMADDDFERQASGLADCYAYCLGFFDEKGNYQPASRISGAQAFAPIMADAPPLQVETGNSANHGGYGQNILFQDGHAVFFKSRVFKGDDIYLNDAHKVGAGLGRGDVVLGSSASKPW